MLPAVPTMFSEPFPGPLGASMIGMAWRELDLLRGVLFRIM